MEWIGLKGEPISNISDFPDNTYGFVYRIVHKPTGKTYIGKKVLYYERKVKLTQKDLKMYEGVVGRSDFTFNCNDIFRAPASEIGRIVTIANVNSAVGSDLILGAPDPGDDPYTANGASKSARFDTVCNSIGDEVNIVVIGSKTVAIYGSGI